MNYAKWLCIYRENMSHSVKLSFLAKPLSQAQASEVKTTSAMLGLPYGKPQSFR